MSGGITRSSLILFDHLKPNPEEAHVAGTPIYEFSFRVATVAAYHFLPFWHNIQYIMFFTEDPRCKDESTAAAPFTAETAAQKVRMAAWNTRDPAAIPKGGM
jgi:hypothetical protein